MLRKTIFICLMLGLTLTLGMTGYVARAQAADGKIGVFNLQRAINESKKGQATKGSIIKKFEKMQNELKLREAEIQKFQQEVERQSSMLSPDARREKEKSLQRKVRDFQDQYRDYTEEMKRAEMEATQPIVNDVLKIANEYGKEKGFALILEGQTAGVIYAPNSSDITDDVIKRYDGQK
ncbi:MAG: OmpH family outer membrane protein [Proteobacteria bacterium]|nr:OmpH family outer membrane protein [Pseudomonadota bacterium]